MTICVCDLTVALSPSLRSYLGTRVTSMKIMPRYSDLSRLSSSSSSSKATGLYTHAHTHTFRRIFDIVKENRRERFVRALLERGQVDVSVADEVVGEKATIVVVDDHLELILGQVGLELIGHGAHARIGRKRRLLLRLLLLLLFRLGGERQQFDAEAFAPNRIEVLEDDLGLENTHAVERELGIGIAGAADVANGELLALFEINVELVVGGLWLLADRLAAAERCDGGSSGRDRRRRRGQRGQRLLLQRVLLELVVVVVVVAGCRLLGCGAVEAVLVELVDADADGRWFGAEQAALE